MYDKKKIAFMTRLAVYDKNFAEEDLQTDQYFRHDYIYKKNMKNRIFVFIGCLIVMSFYILNRVMNEDFDIYAINYTVELVKIILFFAVMLVGYTVIGTIIYTAEFHKAQERLEKYFKLLERLDKYTAAAEKRKKFSEAEQDARYDLYEHIDDEDDINDDDTEADDDGTESENGGGGSF